MKKDGKRESKTNIVGVENHGGCALPYNINLAGSYFSVSWTPLLCAFGPTKGSCFL